MHVASVIQQMRVGVLVVHTTPVEIDEKSAPVFSDHDVWRTKITKDKITRMQDFKGHLNLVVNLPRKLFLPSGISSMLCMTTMINPARSGGLEQ
jgi:hypothetical protein